MSLRRSLSQVTTEALDAIGYGFLSLRQRAKGHQDGRRKILVNGCPKSGTTWMLRLIASIPGYHEVGNFRGDHSRYFDLKPGDVAHGHDEYTDELWDMLRACEVRVVLMVRDPRDQAVSRMYHALRDPSHPFHDRIKKLELSDALLASIQGDHGIRGVAMSIEFTAAWLRSGADVRLVRYERLWEDAIGEFRSALAFLGIPLSSDLCKAIVHRNRFSRQTIGRRIWKAGRHPGEEDPTSHFRKGIVGDWRNHFTEVHLQCFNELAEAQLQSIGYDISVTP